MTNPLLTDKKLIDEITQAVEDTLIIAELKSKLAIAKEALEDIIKERPTTFTTTAVDVLSNSITLGEPEILYDRVTEIAEVALKKLDES